MLRRKHRTTANLKQDEDRNISRYLDSFLSQIRHPVNRIIRRNDIRNDEVTKEESTSGSSNKETTRPEKIETQKKLRTIDNAVTIGLTNLDKPGPSRIQSNKTPQTSQKKSKTTREKTTQMYQNLSTQRLKGSEDIDEDSSLLEDEQPRPKYILVGWDSFRSKLMLLLLILLILWAVIYFPLIGT
ncbi:uncharacterized protein LOC100875130 isoform X2 [Megachile rotundata]|uniref:uncharacterized protein LOC100875130 isoform X2 n=1 Tax=Megachile rotundata TaxID=143995 RepID=UPI000258F353|nr:PREDICTED: uncharacterized protein LOC100875130 isoform X2 [Megachile rotundata]